MSDQEREGGEPADEGGAEDVPAPSEPDDEPLDDDPDQPWAT